MPAFQTIVDPVFVKFRRKISRYPRMHGYYLMDVVSIESMRSAGLTQEEILDAVFEFFDDQTWPPPADRPSDVSWSQHEVEGEVAEQIAVRALIGGTEVGHKRDTMPPKVARSLWREFQGFFQGERRYYVGMGLGDYKYAYLQGAAVVDETRAGVLWVVEND